MDLTVPKFAEEEILEDSEAVEREATTLASQIKKASISSPSPEQGFRHQPVSY